MAMTLEPCPFCGGNAQFSQYKRDGLRLKCESLGCVDFKQRVMTRSLDWLQEKMTEHWNTRAHLSHPAQAVDVGAMIEAIASEWDGCKYEAVGEDIDIGEAIRLKAKQLTRAIAAPPSNSPTTGAIGENGNG